MTLKAEDVGFARIKTRSGRYIIPAQIDLFDGERVQEAREAVERAAAATGRGRVNMPYYTDRGRMERSRSFGHVPIVQSPFVQERLRTYRFSLRKEIASQTAHSYLTPPFSGSPSADVRWVIAFDGSSQEVEVREEFPSTRIGYIQVAGVLTDLRRMLSQDDERFVDPAVIHDAAQEALHSIVLPGSNVCRPDMPTVKDSWRAEVYEIFREYLIEDRSPLDVFMLLVDFSDKRSASGVILARCSADEACSARDIEVPRDGRQCPVVAVGFILQTHCEYMRRFPKNTGTLRRSADL